MNSNNNDNSSRNPQLLTTQKYMRDSDKTTQSFELALMLAHTATPPTHMAAAKICRLMVSYEPEIDLSK